MFVSLALSQTNPPTKHFLCYGANKGKSGD